MRTLLSLLVFVCFLNADLSGQIERTMTEKENKNPLLCDPAEGICEIPGQKPVVGPSFAPPAAKPVRILYFTDPICSSCWGIEPQLRKLKMEYGHLFEIEYRMGGLLPDWSYNSGGISKPSDVALHWDEVSIIYKMPIDGDIWLEDPLDSSYPPSIAFKAAQMQDEKKAILFLRKIREMVFLEKKNITRMEFLEAAAEAAGLEPERFREDYEKSAETLFQQDLESAKKMGVRGFPTLIFNDSEGNQFKVSGFKPYATFENALLKIVENAQKVKIDASPDFLFRQFNTLTTGEYAELSDISWDESEKILTTLWSAGKVSRKVTKNGMLWESTK